jgi:hypothetical protein
LAYLGVAQVRENSEDEVSPARIERIMLGADLEAQLYDHHVVVQALH